MASLLLDCLYFLPTLRWEIVFSYKKRGDSPRKHKFGCSSLSYHVVVQLCRYYKLPRALHVNISYSYLTLDNLSDWYFPSFFHGMSHFLKCYALKKYFLFFSKKILTENIIKFLVNCLIPRLTFISYHSCCKSLVDRDNSVHFTLLTTAPRFAKDNHDFKDAPISEFVQ